jgi:hypothetical protein
MSCRSLGEFEDIKGVITIRKLKNNRQRNGQKKKDKRASIYKTLHRKLKLEQDEPHSNSGVFRNTYQFRRATVK